MSTISRRSSCIAASYLPFASPAGAAVSPLLFSPTFRATASTASRMDIAIPAAASVSLSSSSASSSAAPSMIDTDPRTNTSACRPICCSSSSTDGAPPRSTAHSSGLLDDTFSSSNTPWYRSQRPEMSVIESFRSSAHSGCARAPVAIAVYSGYSGTRMRPSPSTGSSRRQWRRRRSRLVTLPSRAACACSALRDAAAAPRERRAVRRCVLRAAAGVRAASGVDKAAARSLRSAAREQPSVFSSGSTVSRRDSRSRSKGWMSEVLRRSFVHTMPLAASKSGSMVPVLSCLLILSNWGCAAGCELEERAFLAGGASAAAAAAAAGVLRFFGGIIFPERAFFYCASPLL
eukprot:Rhum_TRINITY_DN15176_c4_g2::Rhum_TRINITY_DN15176_c4_g2_i3::g.142363::m.142363